MPVPYCRFANPAMRLPPSFGDEERASKLSEEATMPAYTPVIAAPARQLLTHVEDACHIGMESIDLLAALLYAVEQLGSQARRRRRWHRYSSASAGCWPPPAALTAS